MTSRGSLRRLWSPIEDLKANIFDPRGRARRLNGLGSVSTACSIKRHNRINQALEPSRGPRRGQRWPAPSGHATVRDIVPGTLNRIIGHMQYNGIHLWPELLDRKRELERSSDTVVLEVTAIDGAFYRTPKIVARK